MDETTQGGLTEQALTRVCRRCSVQSTVAGAHCPHCGASYAGRRRPSRKALGLSVLALLLVVGLAVGGLLWKNHSDQVAADKRAAAVEKREAAAEQQAAEEQAAEEAAQAKAAADLAAAEEAERTARQAAIKELQRNITKHAKELVGEQLLEGPILYTQCTATGGGSADDLTALTGTFDCLAANEERKDGTISGYSYSGTIDWDSGQLSWKLGG